ncbi:MAG: SxtJ family membrane protein [Gammaproteobacteria bacterium]|nr:SxtJ family membrane protein [Gammaproteobacteria bacterium]
MHTIPELDNPGLRRFGLMMGGVIAILFGLLLPWLFSAVLPLWPWLLAGAFLAVALVRPAALRPIYRGWMHFGYFMSRITTPLLLGLVFFLAIVPTALIMRLLKRDPLARALDPELDSYRVDSNKAPTENLEKPF